MWLASHMQDSQVTNVKWELIQKKIVEKISPAFQLSVTKNIQLNNSQFNTIIIHMTFNLIQVQLNS
jgi:hypothetical protein